MAKHDVPPWTTACLKRTSPRANGTENSGARSAGTVHDPGAAMMGGVACHAGLFSNAYDLAELAETWRRGGVFKGIRIVPEDVLDQWTSRAFADDDNRRGLAFDKPALEPTQAPPATCVVGELWPQWIHRHVGVGGPRLRFGLRVLEQPHLRTHPTKPCFAWTHGRRFNAWCSNIWGHKPFLSHDRCPTSHWNRVLPHLRRQRRGGDGARQSLGRPRARGAFHHVHQPVRLGSFHPACSTTRWRCPSTRSSTTRPTNWS